LNGESIITESQSEWPQNPQIDSAKKSYYAFLWSLM
jgi:hypothetical protein